MAVPKPHPSLAGSCSFAAQRRCGHHQEAPAAGTMAETTACEPRAASTADPAAAAADGVRIGSLDSYYLIAKIGQGAFGVVWRASDRRSGEVVAIKSSVRVGGGGAALLREARMLAACAGNPAVVALREVAARGGRGETTSVDDELHLVMEYVGPSLHDVAAARRRAGRPFTETEARRLMRRLLGGVEAMHGRGVVHCDLKPGNVLLGGLDGRGRRVIKICDLGLARSSGDAPLPDATDDLEGTLWYMAPKQLLGNADIIGAPADLWSLGCVMAELVAGEPLFQEDNVYQQVARIVELLGIPDEASSMPLGVSTSAPSRLRDMVPEERLSHAGFDVLRGLLEFDPKDRLTAAAALQKPWFEVDDDAAPAAAGP